MFRWLFSPRAPAKLPDSEASAEVKAGRAKIEAGDLDGAESVFRFALDANPGDVQALLGLGEVMFARNRPAEALELLLRALDIDSRLALARVNAVQCLRILGRLDAAVEHCHELMARDPAGPGVALLARCLDQLGRFKEAEAAFLSALDLTPDDAGLWSDYGALLMHQERGEEAEEALRRALEADPQHAPALNNLGMWLLESNRPAQAEALFDCALGLPNSPPQVLSNLAILRQSQNRIQEAFDLYDVARGRGLDAPDAHFSRAILLLLAGRLEEGFEAYEHRFATRAYAGMSRSGPGHLWRGEPLAGRRILLWQEQGLGDTVQFVRYARRLAALGAEVIAEVQAPLVRLLSASLPATVVAPGTKVVADFHCPLMSLPHRLGESAIRAPWEGPYVRAMEPGGAAAAVASLTRPRVGLVWAGSPSHKNDANRSMPLSALEPLLAMPGVNFCALQFGPAAAQAAGRPARVSWTDLAPLINDFAETAAALKELDMLVTVDTSAAHVAGAMGLPALVLLPFSPDWRWQLEREDSPWYPSLRLLRQHTPRDWVPVVREAVARIAGVVGAE